MNNKKDEVEAVLDNCIIQLTELTCKLNVLTSMVMNVYNETLPEATFLHIAKKYFSELEKHGSEMYDLLQKDDLLSDPAIGLRRKFDFLLSIQALKDDYGL